MKLGIDKKIKENIDYFKEGSKEFIDSAAQTKGVSFKNISQVRLCIVIIIIALIYSFYGNTDRCMNRQMQIRRQLSKCQSDIDSLNSRIKEYNYYIEKIDNDNEFLEEYARENYYMSDNNEEIIIIEN
ncbi:MAG: septum formation initiator family protein [Rikenellaceae bacterium]